MANRISEDLFKAIDVIVGQRLRNVSKDLTILCKIEDNADAEQGFYTVSNEEARFTAVSEKTDYRIGQNVWVLVPEGNYNQDKIIIGKYVNNNTDQPYVWVDPLHSYVDITGNLIADSLNFEDGIIANYTHPVDIFSGEEYEDINTLSDLVRYWMTWIENDDDENSPFTPIDDAGGFTQIGFSADFATAFGDLRPIKGNYGVMLLFKTQRQVGVNEYTYLPFSIVLDTDDMYGDPYNFVGYSTQSVAKVLDPAINGTPVGVAGVFYQLNNFKDSDNENIPYEYDGELLNPNIFVKNMYLSLGYNISDIADDTLYLFTRNTLDYIINNESFHNPDYAKILETRFIYVDDNSRIAINSMDDLNDRMDELSGLKELMPIIRWYRFKQKEGVQDLRAGELWEEFYPDPYTEENFDWFSCSVNDLQDTLQEEFKCILCYNSSFLYYLRSYLLALQNEHNDYATLPEYIYWNRIWEWAFKKVSDWNAEPTAGTPEYAQFDEDFPYDTDIYESGEDQVTADMILERWASTDQKIESEHLVFTSATDPWASDRDLIQGLRVQPADNSNGVFNLYDATFGANNTLVNPADEQRTRMLKATFWSAVTGNESMDEVERIAWYIPKNNTMIKKPEPGVSYQMYKPVELTEETFSTDGPQYYTWSGNQYVAIAPDATFDEDTVYYIFTHEELVNDWFEDTTPGHDTQSYICNGLGITSTEYEYFTSEDRLKNYYIILDDEVQTVAQRTKEATMVYFIKPELKKLWTNNTIYASGYRFGKVYDGELAQFTPTFGARGTNGTPYTLSLTIDSEMAGSAAEPVKIANPPAWTLPKNGDSITQPTRSMLLQATIFDADDKDVTENARFEWTILYPTIGLNSAHSDSDATHPDGWGVDEYISNRTTATPTMNSWVSSHGWILKCVARLSGGSVLRLTGYLIIPVRGNRKWVGMDGPAIIRYSSSGTNPAFYDHALGLLDINGEIKYNYTSVDVRTLYETVTGGRTGPNPFTFDGTNIGNNYNAEGHVISEVDGENTGTGLQYLKNYFPTCITQTEDGSRHLKPKAMYFHNVTYSLYLWFKFDDNYNWSQPILVLLDPYGNQYLNNWGGKLTFDYDNDAVMSAIMGAGKKDTDNKFTGILLGNLPKIDSNTTRTGMVGYHQGDEYYHLYDDGSIALGKSGVAQLLLNGTNGYIKNNGYDNNNGIKIDFMGGTGATQYPYIDAKASNGARVYIGTNSNFLMVKAADAGTTTGKNLLYVGTGTYYLQTNNYSSTGTTGLRIDLSNGTFDSKGVLTINGAAGSKIRFGGNSNYLEMGYANGVGYLTTSGTLDASGTVNSVGPVHITGGPGSYIKFGNNSNYIQLSTITNTNGVVTGGKLESTGAINISGTVGSEIHFGGNSNYIKLGYHNDGYGYLTSSGRIDIVGDASSKIKFGNTFSVSGNGTVILGNLTFVNSAGTILRDSDNHEASGIYPQWLTFVTNISGTITKSQVEVQVPIQVSTSTSTSRTFTYTTYTASPQSFSLYSRGATHIIPDAYVEDYTVQRVDSTPSQSLLQPDDRWPVKTFEHNITTNAIIATTSRHTETLNASLEIDETFTGLTSYPVVTAINLNIEKRSMWALTNSDATTETVTITDEE